jgi:hypothetical protein
MRSTKRPSSENDSQAAALMLTPADKPMAATM